MLSMPMTLWPRASIASARWLPRKPATPVTKILAMLDHQKFLVGTVDAGVGDGHFVDVPSRDDVDQVLHVAVDVLADVEPAVFEVRQQRHNGVLLVAGLVGPVVDDQVIWRPMRGGRLHLRSAGLVALEHPDTIADDSTFLDV